MPKKIKSVKKSKSSKPKSSGMTDITPIERKWLDGRDIQALKDEYEVAYWTEQANKAEKIANQNAINEMIRVQEYHEAGFGHILDTRYGPHGPPMSQVFHTRDFLSQPTHDEILLNQQNANLDRLTSFALSMGSYLVIGICLYSWLG